MTEKKVRTQLPGQSESKYPNAGKPHPRVIVQVTCFAQFLYPLIERLDLGLPIHRAVVAVTTPFVVADHLEDVAQILLIALPKQGSMFKPSLPIGAPKYFLYELKRF